MTADQVVEAVGSEPKSVESRPDGGFTFVYHRGTEEPYVEEDAMVAFSSQGFVVSVTFERTTAPLAETKSE